MRNSPSAGLASVPALSRTDTHTSGVMLSYVSGSVEVFRLCVRQYSNVAPPSGLPWLSSLCQIRVPSLNSLTALPVVLFASVVETGTLMLPWAVARATVADAEPVTVPAVSLVNVTVQVPTASDGVSPASPVPFAQLFTTLSASPTRPTVTAATSTAAKPLPVFASTVTVNVCDSPMLFTSSGSMPIRASTNRLIALPVVLLASVVETGTTMLPWAVVRLTD